MLLFKPEHVVPILSGAKTQTRRVGARRWREGAEHDARLNFTTPPFARLRITSVRRQAVYRISTADAVAEGYPNRQAFFAAWDRVTGEPRTTRVWVVSFVVVRAGDAPAARPRNVRTAFP